MLSQSTRGHALAEIDVKYVTPHVAGLSKRRIGVLVAGFADQQVPEIAIGIELPVLKGSGLPIVRLRLSHIAPSAGQISQVQIRLVDVQLTRNDLLEKLASLLLLTPFEVECSAVEHMLETVDKLGDRIQALESILDADHPDWRQQQSRREREER